MGHCAAASFSPPFRLQHFLLSALLLFVAPLVAKAQTGLKLQLVSEVTSIQPGQPFSVGLFIQHEPGWHTYWQQPGIVGVPTNIEWQLPPGFQAGPLQYPAPQQVMMFQIRAQGFERDVLLQTQITPPADLKPGSEVTLQAKASWMCCGNTCHPDTRPFSLTLKVASVPSTMPALDQQWHPVFEQERTTFPQASDAWQATAIEQGKEIILTLQPDSPKASPLPENPEVIFFTEDGWINSDSPQKQELLPGGGLRITLLRADVFLGKTIPQTLTGVLQRKNSWLTHENLSNLRISPKIQRAQPLSAP